MKKKANKRRVLHGGEDNGDAIEDLRWRVIVLHMMEMKIIKGRYHTYTPRLLLVTQLSGVIKEHEKGKEEQLKEQKSIGS